MHEVDAKARFRAAYEVPSHALPHMELQRSAQLQGCKLAKL